MCVCVCVCVRVYVFHVWQDKLHIALGAWDSDITFKVPFYAPQSRFNEAMELVSNKVRVCVHCCSVFRSIPDD